MIFLRMNVVKWKEIRFPYRAYLALLFMVSQIFSAQYVFSIRSMFLLLEVTIASEFLPDEYL